MKDISIITLAVKTWDFAQVTGEKTNKTINRKPVVFFKVAIQGEKNEILTSTLPGHVTDEGYEGYWGGSGVLTRGSRGPRTSRRPTRSG